MKICWDNIEGMSITRNGFFKRNKTYYVERDCCRRCGDAYLTSNSRPSDYCGISCLKKSMVVSNDTKKKISALMSGEKHPWYGRKHSMVSKKKMSISSAGKQHTEKSKLKMSESRKGKKNHFYGKHHTDVTKQKISDSNKGKCLGNRNPSFKGGARKKDLALYSTYGKQIEWCEEVSPIDKDGVETFQVRCSNHTCNKLFIPTFNQVSNRLLVLKEITGGNNRFYCSDECKESCLIYNKPVVLPEEQKLYTTYELQIWSKEVLKRSNYICEYCGKQAAVAHHIQPKKLEPFHALDPDNGLACCSKCHYQYGHKDECFTINIAKTICN